VRVAVRFSIPALMACARKLLIYADTVAQRGTPWTERPLSFNGCYRMVSGDDGLKPWLGVGWLAVDLQALGRGATPTAQLRRTHQQGVQEVLTSHPRGLFRPQALPSAKRDHPRYPAAPELGVAGKTRKDAPSPDPGTASAVVARSWTG
jgi:hypothetical protein